jgi:tetratricopeptide (TPR) repeat protein
MVKAPELGRTGWVVGEFRNRSLSEAGKSLRFKDMKSVAACVCLTMVLFSGMPVLAAVPDDSIACGSWSAQSGALDYRQREVSEFNRWRLNDNNTYHYEPAITRMRAGEYSHRVRADIISLLGQWPNHYPGIEALVRYDLAGGKTYDTLTTECLLSRARRFATGDINVLIAEAYYYWKTNRADRAMESYHEALALDPESMDANYYAGLLYLEMKRYDDALKHALVAYKNGAPLPGLRRMLVDAGKWPSAVESEKAGE